MSERNTLTFIDEMGQEIAEKDKRIEELQPYYDAVRSRHNGYNPDVRKECPQVQEPASPERAIAELIEEATDLGKLEQENLDSERIADLKAKLAQAEEREEKYREVCKQAVGLYETYGLVARSAFCDPWINAVRDALSGPPAGEKKE